jgi:uncharacterized protein
LDKDKNKLMGNLRSTIQQDMQGAIKAREELRTSVLRMFFSAIRNKEIALRQGEDVVLKDEQVLEILNSEIKKRKDSEAVYAQAGRHELAGKEQAEIKILEVYLPAQLSDAELEVIIKNAAVEAGSNANFGQVMGKAMPAVKGKADGARVSAMVTKILG